MAFDGDKKVGRSILANAEDKLKALLLPHVPSWIETYHLTATTVLWSGLVIVFSFLARYDLRWMWLTSLMIVLQYVTDLLDGAIGRQRDTGLVKWGYYMDHFLDYVFLCAMLIGYSFLIEDHLKYMLFFIIALFGAFMVNSFLSFAATNEFKISYLGIGPTEIRIVFISVNTLLIYQRTWLVNALPWALALSAFGLFVTVYRTQKLIWAIDMKSKHGDNWKKDDPDVIEEIKRQEWSIGLSGRRIAIDVVISMVLMVGALSFWMMRLTDHWHIIAGSLYCAAWLPFVVSTIQKRKILRERGRQIKGVVRPYIAYVIVAMGLLGGLLVARALIPMEGGLPIGDLAEHIEVDMQNLNVLESGISSLLDWMEKEPVFKKDVAKLSLSERNGIKDSWDQFVTTAIELDLMKRKYAGFHKIDKLQAPSEYADAFYLTYASLVCQLRSSLRVVQLVDDNEFLSNILNETGRTGSVHVGSYGRIKSRLTHPMDFIRLNAGLAMLRLIKKDLSGGPGRAERLERNVLDYYKSLGRTPEVPIKSAVALLERSAFAAWFPLQKEVARQMSLIRTTRRDYFISKELLLEYRDRLQPGDIVLERRNWYMSNVGIPGFWPHVALYIGTAAELDKYFAGLPVLEGKRASEHIRDVYPKAFRSYESLDEDEYDKCVIEALRPGIVFTSWEVSGNADYIAVVRPILSRVRKFNGVLAAFGHHKKPYDYNFDFATDAELVCSELVYKSYESGGGLTLEPKVLNGRLLITPNYFAEKFDIEYGTTSQEMDFVFFLDGIEERGTAISRDVEAFRSTWRRPKWDIMLD